jgi:DNA-directed RNA polymerase beta subunit
MEEDNLDDLDCKQYMVDTLQQGSSTTQSITVNNISNTKNTTIFGSLEPVPSTYPKETVMDIDEKIGHKDMSAVIYSEIKRKGLAGHQKSSMNNFYNTGIEQIVTKIFSIDHTIENKRDKTDEDKKISNIIIKVDFTGVNLTPPMTTLQRSGKPEPLTPNMTRLRGLTYSGQLDISAKLTAIAVLKDGKTIEKTEEIKNRRIASIPIMVGTEPCHTYRCTRETLLDMEEDPDSPGGMFIIKGVEWVVDSLENILINGYQVFKNQYQNEIARGTFISKPGDHYENSFRIILRYLNSGAITIQITTTNKHEEMEIPFYIVFRAFGVVEDQEIVNHIVYGVDNSDPVTLNIINKLDTAFTVIDKTFDPIKNVRDPEDINLFIAQKMQESATNINFRRDDNATKFVYNNMMGWFDKHIFPHIGLDKNSRIKKMRYLGLLINRLLKVDIGVLDSTDRDSYKNKRVHTAGVSLAKAFKSQFNFIIVQEIKKQLIKAFTSNTFSNVKMADAFAAAVSTADLERVLIQVIITGNKTITVKRNDVPNRVSSQQLYHKNDVNVISTLNNINTANSSAAKQTERSDEMRRVHPTYLGFIDPIQSAETGEKVGMSKQMASSASITDASSSYIMKDIIFADPSFLPLDTVKPEEFTNKKLFKIFVNGDWIGGCEKGHLFVAKYRNARRYGDINPYVSIVWEPLDREIYFWTDVGRLIRPLIIVYNNLEDYNESHSKKKDIPFKQWIKLTKSHINKLQDGTIGMDDLRKEHIVEYITPDEQDNTLIATNIDTLRKYKNDITMRFTHCDIEYSIFGHVVLSASNTNHTNSTKITVFTAHKKQTCGWYALNWPFRIDKGTTLQYYCETPIIRSFSDAFTRPNGQNIILAYQLYSGYNMEDSAIVNRRSIDLGMFSSSNFYFEKSELEKGEQFGFADMAQTMDIKKDAIYGHIGPDGIVKKGTIVKKGYVLIVKVVALNHPEGPYKYKDNSVVYKFEESAFVEDVIVARNDDDVLTAKVKLRRERPLRIGDKVGSSNGNKSIIAVMLDASDMPYAEDGLVPDLILNAHAIPTRMVIGQIEAGVMAEFAVRHGSFIDGKPFQTLDINKYINELDSKYNIKYGGHRRLFNGRTGFWMDTLIFVAPTYYQRLQKFVIDEAYSVSHGPTCALTRQPLEGKSNHGGLRLGEMEGWVMLSHGAMRTMNEKFRTHSDGILLPICRNCGFRAIVNEKRSIYKCKRCGDSADIANVPSSWTANLFFNEVSAMNIPLKFDLEPIGYSTSE